MLPPPSFVRGYLLRGAVLWVAIHLGAGFAVTASGGRGLALSLGSPAVAFLLGAVFLASHLEDRSRRDDVFLANLGVAPAGAALVSTAAAFVLEVGLQLALEVS